MAQACGSLVNYISSIFTGTLLFQAYRAAIDNEFRLTQFWGFHVGHDESAGWIPNNAMLGDRSVAHAQKFKMLIYLGTPVWFLLILPILIFRTMRCWRPGRQSPVSLKGQNLYLNLSSPVNLKFVADQHIAPEINIQFPWRKRNVATQLQQSYCFFDFVRGRDIVKACLLTYSAAIRFLFSKRDRPFFFYTYNAFQWYLVFLVLDNRHPKSVWVSNHYDRWAILVDNLSCDDRKMVQHGALVDVSKKTGLKITFTPPQKLRKKWTLFLAMESDRSVFARDVFERLPKIVSIEINMQFFNLDGSEPAVLVLGNPRLRDWLLLEIKTLRKLFQKEIQIVFRPHPRESIESCLPLFEQLDIQVNADTEQVPRTEFVLTYGSSLDAELLQQPACEVFTCNFNLDIQRKSALDALHRSLGKRLKGE